MRGSHGVQVCQEVLSGTDQSLFAEYQLNDAGLFGEGAIADMHQKLALLASIKDPTNAASKGLLEIVQLYGCQAKLDKLHIAITVTQNSLSCMTCDTDDLLEYEALVASTTMESLEQNVAAARHKLVLVMSFWLLFRTVSIPASEHLHARLTLVPVRHAECSKYGLSGVRSTRTTN
jgi:hypothetical protein